MIESSGSKARAMLKAFATVIIWGATFVATKVALREVSPATVIWLRFGMGLLVLGAVVWMRKEAALPQRSDLVYLGVLGFLGVAFHQWLQGTGLLTARATTTAWIVAITPIFIASLGAVVLHERVNAGQAVGIGLATLGVLLVVSKGEPRELLRGRGFSVGDILVLISAANWAAYTVLSRRGLARLAASQMMFHVMFFGWAFVTVWFLGGRHPPEIMRLSAAGWIAVVGLGIFGSGFAYIMYFDALRVLPASQLGVFLNIEPLVTMLLAAPVLGEQITSTVLLGGLLIIGGVVLVNRKSNGR